MLSWRLETTNDQGQTVYYTIYSLGGSAYAGAWTSDGESAWSQLSDRMIPNSVSNDAVILDFKADDIHYGFWQKNGIDGGFDDVDLTLRFRYAGRDFEGTPYQLQMNRVGSVPDTPVLEDPVAVSGTSGLEAIVMDTTPRFDWDDTNGAWFYEVSLEGIFLDSAVSPPVRLSETAITISDRINVSVFQAMTGTTGESRPVMLEYGQEYTLKVQAFNPLGASNMLEVTVKPELPLVFKTGQTSYTNFPVKVVDDCAEMATFSVPLDEVNGDAFWVHWDRGYTTGEEYWNGAYWQAEPFYYKTGISVVEDGADSKLEYSFPMNEFPLAFWYRSVVGNYPDNQGNTTGYGYDQAHTIALHFSYNGQVFHTLYPDFQRFHSTPPAPVEDAKCYSLNGEPRFEWQASEFADFYHAQLYRVDGRVETLIEESGPIAPDMLPPPTPPARQEQEPIQGITFTTVLDPVLEYKVRVATELFGCLSEYRTIYDHFQYINPELATGLTAQDTNLELIEPNGPQPYTWPITIVDGEYILQPWPHRVKMTGQGPWDYPIHCNEITWSLKHTLAWESQPGYRTGIHNFNNTVTTPPDYYTEDGVYGEWGSYDHQQNLLERIRAEVLDTGPDPDPCFWKEQGYYMAIDFLVIDTHRVDNTGSYEHFASMGFITYDDILIELEVQASGIETTTLGPPSQSEFVVPQNGTRPMQASFDFDFELMAGADESNINTDYFKVRWSRENGGATQYWSGTAWGSDPVLHDITGQENILGSSISGGHALNYATHKFFMTMNSDVINTSAFFDDPENQVELVDVALIYVNSGGACESASESTPVTQTLTFSRESFSIDEMSVGTTIPDPISVYALDPLYINRITIPLDLTTTPAYADLTDLTSQMRWQIDLTHQNPETPIRWNGTVWETSCGRTLQVWQRSPIRRWNLVWPFPIY